MTYYEPFSADQLEAYYKEWNVTPESLKKDAHYLMEWLEQQPHLPNFKDEKYIIGLIQKCKNRLESTKEVLEITFTLRATIPALMVSTDIAEKEYQTMLKMGVFEVPSPKLTPEGHRVWVFQMSKDALKYSPNADVVLGTGFALATVYVSQEQSNGLISVIDFDGMTAAHIAFYSTNLKMLMNVLKMAPRRVIRTYILNLSPIANAIFSFAKTLMKEKLGERIIIWTGKREDLATELPADVLPTEFGGSAGSMEEFRDKYREFATSQRDLIKEASELRADLTKKPPDSKICDELLDFGVDGSFRTLSVE